MEKNTAKALEVLDKDLLDKRITLDHYVEQRKLVENALRSYGVMNTCLERMDYETRRVLTGLDKE